MARAEGEFVPRLDAYMQLRMRTEASAIETIYAQMRQWPREVLDASEAWQGVGERLADHIKDFPDKTTGIIVSGGSRRGKTTAVEQVISWVESREDIQETLKARRQHLAVAKLTTSTGVMFAINHDAMPPVWEFTTPQQFYEIRRQFHISSMFTTEAAARASLVLPEQNPTTGRGWKARWLFVVEEPGFLHGVDVGASILRYFGANEDWEKVAVLSNPEIQDRAVPVCRALEQADEQAILDGLEENNIVIDPNRPFTYTYPLLAQELRHTQGNEVTLQFASWRIKEGIIAMATDPKLSTDFFRRVGLTIPSTPVGKWVNDPVLFPPLERAYFSLMYEKRFNTKNYTLIDPPVIQGTLHQYPGYSSDRELDYRLFVSAESVERGRREFREYQARKARKEHGQ